MALDYGGDLLVAQSCGVVAPDGVRVAIVAAGAGGPSGTLPEARGGLCGLAVVLVLLGLPPIIKLAATVLAYKLLAALLQPVSDKRMTGCLWAMGEGCRLLLKVLITVELLLLITIAVLAVSFISH